MQSKKKWWWSKTQNILFQVDFFQYFDPVWTTVMQQKCKQTYVWHVMVEKFGEKAKLWPSSRIYLHTGLVVFMLDEYYC